MSPSLRAENPPTLRERLVRAVDRISEERSFRFDIAISVAGLADSAADTDSLDITMTGAVAANGDSQVLADISELISVVNGEPGVGSAETEMTDLPFVRPFDTVEIGERSYASMPALLEQSGLGNDTTWVAAEHADKSLIYELRSALPFFETTSPGRLLTAFDKRGDIVVVGKEDIDGGTAFRYRGVLDPTASGPSWTPEERRTIDQMLGGTDLAALTGDLIEADIWVSDTRQIQRIRFTLDHSNLAAEATTDAAMFDALTVDIRYSDVGEYIVIKAPPADQTVTVQELEQALGYDGELFGDGI